MIVVQLSALHSCVNMQSASMKILSIPFFIACAVMSIPALAQEHATTASSLDEAVPAEDAAATAAEAAASHAVAEAMAAVEAAAEDVYRPGEPYPEFEHWNPFAPADYPPASFAAGEEGSVGYRLTVNEQGVATQCEVMRSTGYARLDEATCPAVMRVATFVPALDENDAPIMSEFHGEAVWEIREPEFQDMYIDVAFRQTASGEIEQCKIFAARGRYSKSLRRTLARALFAMFPFAMRRVIRSLAMFA